MSKARKSRAMSSMQKLFNRIVRHLLKQMAQAMRNGACVYRADNGHRCAVGAVLPNRLYTRKMECKTYRMLVDSFPQVEEYFGRDNRDFLTECQNVHDKYKPCEWLDKLTVVAVKFGLDFPKIKSA